MKTEDIVFIGTGAAAVYLAVKWISARNAMPPGSMVRVGANGYPTSKINPAPWAVPLPQYTTGRPPVVDLFSLINPAGPFKAPGVPSRSLPAPAPTVSPRGINVADDNGPDNWDSKYFAPAPTLPPGSVWNDEAEVYQVPTYGGATTQFDYEGVEV